MTETLVAQPSELPSRPRDRFDDVVFSLMRAIGRDQEDGGVGTGDRAELRRMDPLGVALPPAFWRVLFASGADAAAGWLGGGDRERGEQALALLMQAMVVAGTTGNEPVGSVLAETGYAEDRFVRFLRARTPRDVVEEGRRAAHWCATKGAPARFTDRGAPNGFGPFLLHALLANPEAANAEADRRAHALARDYYAALSRGERNTSTDKD